jgi:hypothetical protein
MQRYDYARLAELCKINNINLTKDYSLGTVNIFSTIEGNCLNNDCSNIFSKSFRSLLKTNGYCLSCSTKIGLKKVVKTCLEKYGVENPLKSNEVKNKMKKTCLEKYGSEYASQSQEIKDKVKKTNIEKYGVPYPLSLLETKEKVKKTLMEKFGVDHASKSEIVKEKKKQAALAAYGVEHISQAPEVREKCKQTCLKNFGVEFPMQSKEVIEKRNKTCIELYGNECSLKNKEVKNKSKESMMEKYGVEHPLQNEEIKEKTKNTCLEKYGVEHVSQADEVKNKVKETCFEKYGVYHTMHVPEISEKCSHNCYLSKEYKFPSGKTIKIQGYEKYALDELLNIHKIDENDIINERKIVPVIWYSDENGKKHRHYVDFYIPSKNLCIEVKSKWTLKKKQDSVYLKQEAAKNLGYSYEIWVYDNKGTKISLESSLQTNITCSQSNNQND